MEETTNSSFYKVTVHMVVQRDKISTEHASVQDDQLILTELENLASEES
jgi:hypothetical protein